jgi:hypothetical protein
MSESKKKEASTSATKRGAIALPAKDALTRFQQQAYSYSNALLTVSSGGIAFLALIISQAVSFPCLTSFSKIALLVAWAAFGLCIIATVLVHRRFGNIVAFMCMHDAESDDSDSEVEEFQRDCDVADSWDTVAVWSFVIAIVSSLAFIIAAFYCNT